MKIYTKEQSLKMIGDLSKASVKVFEISNTRCRGNPDVAFKKEIQAAKHLLIALGVEATADEITSALGY